jgi:poly(hydroxyalkanoate) granule-associated protein
MDTNTDLNKDNEKTEAYSIHHMMRKMMLAGFGAISVIQEELEQNIDKLVERGEIAEKDREGILNKMKARRVKFMHHRKEFTHKHFAEALEHFDVPNKTDIDSLNQKITDLEKKIDELNKAKE